jgi:hypothetical protein
MKWLNLDEIKDQLRIEHDFDLEDTKLTLYGESAEQAILDLCRRTYDDFIDNYGAIPPTIRECSLLLVVMSYEHGTPASAQQMYNVGYTFDLKLKPYMRLADGPLDETPIQEVVMGSDTKIAFTADLPDGLLLKDIDFEVKVVNVSQKDKAKDYQKADCIMIVDGAAYVVLVDTEELGVGSYLLKLTVQIPDTDYPSGYRKEVVNINPHISVRG